MPRAFYTAAFGLGLISLLGVQSAVAQSTSLGKSGKTVFTTANPSAVSPTSRTALANAKSRLPMLTDISQVPGFSGPTSQGYGTDNHPFTTKGAYSAAATGAPVTMTPWRATGQLTMTFGSSVFVCTASVIEKGILVTAAHCIQDFGLGPGGSATAVSFVPARHGSQRKYGTWTASVWAVPSVYSDGTDTCAVSGIVCENDIALVIMNKGPAPYATKDIGEVVGRYTFFHKAEGFTSFLGKTAAHVTQMGYPVAFDSGLKMIRTDSLGYQESPNNVIIGSDQTGGSSGGPWLMNFGRDPSSASSTPSFNQANKVFATTSWGFVSDTVKVQGASRFANNDAYPSGPSNIASMLNDACAAYPTKCY